ncbi:hypothetical protein ACWFR5_18265 [Streptomyces sp. NPDC055092]
MQPPEPAPRRPAIPHTDAGCEIETFDEVVAAHGSLAGRRVQGVDLTERTDELLTLDAQGAVFLGSPMGPDAAARIRATPPTSCSRGSRRADTSRRRGSSVG